MLKNILKILSMLFFNLLISGALAYSAEIRLSIDTVVIDPGFGGYDSGPTGCDGREVAKDLNLKIARKVVNRIKKELNLKAVLTRDIDKYISLEDRLSVSTVNKADLLISLHTNGTADSKISGIETYYLDISYNQEAILEVAKENSSNPTDATQLNSILSDLMKNAKIRESEFLAKSVHNSLVKHLIQKNKNLVNRGVKKAPFYLLLGSEVPTILIEIGFISNPIECDFLRSADYQNEIGNAIVDGIKEYMKNK